MEIKNILTADFIDILFDGKNKAYGAYALRKTYNRRIALALGGTVFVCLLFIAGNIFANSYKNKKQVFLVDGTVNLDRIKRRAKADPPPPKQEQPKIKTVAFTMPVISKEVTTEEEIKPVEEIDNVKIGTANVEGENSDMVAPPVESKGTGNVEAPKAQAYDYEREFAVVQIDASFPGGVNAWRKYLERSLNTSVPVENGAPPATYTVSLTFLVDRSGNISEVKAENDPGFGVKEEAIRVIQKGPKWIAAEQNGHKVIYRHRQTVSL